MYKNTFNTFKNNIESLTTKLSVNSMFYRVLNFIGSILTNRLLKRTEDLYNNPNPILLFNHTATPYRFPVLIAKKNLLYPSKI